MSNILLTGYKGFIGKNMLEALKTEHNLTLFEWGETLPDLKNQDWCIHLGAISSTTATNVEQVMLQNYDFSCWLLDQCVKYDVNLQYSSSASIYGHNKEFKETSPVDPKTPYAWSKYMFEKYACSVTNKIFVQGFRYFNVYGPGEEHKSTQASPFYQFKQQALLYNRITLFTGSETTYRDFVHVSKVVDIHKKFLSIPESGIWNLGTGKTKSFAEIAHAIANETNSKIDYIPIPNNIKNSYQKYTCADLTHLHHTLEKYNALGRSA